MENGKIVKVNVPTKESYLNNKAYLIETKEDFKINSCGNVERLIHNGKEFIYVDTENVSGNGHHLALIFRKDVDKWLEKNGNTMPKWDNNYKEQMFNINAIEKHLCEPLVMIDINDCYWRTAYLLGYITEKTYVKGLRKKEWKIGRNACVGGLAKTTVEISYVGGKKQTRRVVHSKQEYQFVRNHIIGHIHTIFNRMFSQMGNTFFMMLTDCLVTTYGKLRYVEDELKSWGYKVKHKPIEFTGLNRETRCVSWLDFTGGGKTFEGVDIAKEKYYIYANHQVVHSELVDTSGYFQPPSGDKLP